MRRSLFLALVLASSLGAAKARAGADAHARLSARAIAEQGDEQFYAGRCDKAVLLWLRADAVFHAPTLLVRVARCQSLLGQVVAAAASLQSIVDEPLSPDAPPAFVAARDDARRELPRVRARIASLRIVVRSRLGAGARIGTVPVTVEIDGGAVTLGPTALAIDPGTHRIEVRADRASWAREVHLDDGEVRALDVALWVEPLPTVPEAQRGAGLLALGLGAASLATGVGLSVSALSTARGLAAICGPDRAQCPPSAQGAIDRTRAYSAAADSTLAGGALLVVAGAVLLTADLHLGRDARLRLLASPRGVAVAGAL
jgi:hypothetical protein